MLRYVSFLLVFCTTFAIGLICAPANHSLLEKSIQPGPNPAAEARHDFFEIAAPERPKPTVRYAPPKKTFCSDSEILPIWNALFRDKESREVLEYSTDVQDCREILEIKYIDLNGDRRKEVLVRAVTIPSCGAVGNCDFWVLEKRTGRHRILLHGDDYWDASRMGEQVLRNRTKGYRDILLKGHFSASDTSYSTYRFNGNRYIESRCRYHIPDHENSTADETKWHFVTCNEYARRLAN